MLRLCQLFCFAAATITLCSLPQDGTIGDDIVVKPLDAHIRQALNAQEMDAERRSSDDGAGGGILADYIRSLNQGPDSNRGHFELHDDYAFLDEDEDLEDEDVFVGKPQNSIARSMNLNGGEQRGRWVRRKRVKREDNSSDVDDDEYNEIDVDGDGEFEVDEAATSQIRSDVHIIFKRRNSHLQHPSDYRKSHLRCRSVTTVTIEPASEGGMKRVIQRIVFSSWADRPASMAYLKRLHIRSRSERARQKARGRK